MQSTSSSTSQSKDRFTAAVAHDKLRLFLDDMHKSQARDTSSLFPRPRSVRDLVDGEHKRRKTQMTFNEFVNQPKYAIARQEREAALNSMIDELRDQLQRAEIADKTHLAIEFNNQLRIHGIREVERKMVPAYVFHKFPQLPAELQQRVWFFAARACDERVYLLRGGLSATGNQQLVSVSISHERLWLRKGLSSPYDPDRPIPALLHVCAQSRAICLEVFCLFAWKSNLREQHPPRSAYFNTDYGIFYMARAESIFNRHQVSPTLQTLILQFKLGTLSGQQATLVEHFKNLQRVRHLAVPARTFSKYHPMIWSLLGNLKTLKVVICFEDFYDDRGFYKPHQHMRFIVPHPNSPWGRRATWMSQEVSQDFKSVQDQCPKWTMPNIEVVVGLSEALYALNGSEMIQREDDRQSDECKAKESKYVEGWRRCRAVSVDPWLINDLVEIYDTRS